MCANRRATQVRHNVASHGRVLEPPRGAARRPLLPSRLTATRRARNQETKHPLRLREAGTKPAQSRYCKWGALLNSHWTSHEGGVWEGGQSAQRLRCTTHESGNLTEASPPARCAVRSDRWWSGAALTLAIVTKPRVRLVRTTRTVAGPVLVASPTHAWRPPRACPPRPPSRARQPRARRQRRARSARVGVSRGAPGAPRRGGLHRARTTARRRGAG